jgi:hypothetical protein
MNVFLKIQKNHVYRSANTFFKRQLTYRREFSAMNKLKAMTKAVPRLLEFAEWNMGRDRYAVIVTEALDDWLPVNKWLASAPPPEERHAALHVIAETLRSIHAQNWAHFSLYPKHVFIKQTGAAAFQVKLIDFEKCRKTLTQGQSIIEDLSRYLRHSPNLSQEDKIHFLKAYFQTERFRPSQKALIRRMRGVQQV